MIVIKDNSSMCKNVRVRMFLFQVIQVHLMNMWINFDYKEQSKYQIAF